MSNHHPPLAVGLETRSPAWEDRGYLKIINTPGALSKLTITTGGHLTWEYRPRKLGHDTPARLAAIIVALLGPAACLSPPLEASADRTLLSLAGRARASYDLKVILDIVDISQTDYTTYAKLRITNPARPGGCSVSLALTATIWWECRTQLSLSLDGIAAAIAHALTATPSPD